MLSAKVIAMRQIAEVSLGSLGTAMPYAVLGSPRVPNETDQVLLVLKFVEKPRMVGTMGDCSIADAIVKSSQGGYTCRNKNSASTSHVLFGWLSPFTLAEDGQMF